MREVTGFVRLIVRSIGRATIGTGAIILKGNQIPMVLRACAQLPLVEWQSRQSCLSLSFGVKAGVLSRMRKLSSQIRDPKS